MSEGIQELQEAVRAGSRWVVDPAGREVKVVTDADALEIADRFGQTLGTVYRESLRSGICPYRYLRNRDCISIQDQLKLASSKVAVIGAGGLGGHVVHLLARVGIGHLVVVDCDVFDETNLNRQLFCTSDSVGAPKARVAAEQVQAINPGVEATPWVVRIDENSLPGILAGSDLVVDALDNVRDRLVLEAGARAHAIPLVHGALAGFDGQVMTVFPEDTGLSVIYGTADRAGKGPPGAEAVLGVPALMPGLVATLQAMEVFKILLGRGPLLRNVLVHASLDAVELNRFPLG
jgi:molybdopterin/thiamine biosynthesis adenylyltransferase